MTVPPGGPYGQDPYGTNPYGQQPYWGGQPQGQPPGQPPTQPGSYPYPPPDGQYPPPGTDPYGAPGYPPQHYEQPGQQPPPGWQPGPYQQGPYQQGPYQQGPYQPGPPPGGSNSKLPWLIVAGIAVVGVILLVVILVVNLGGKDNGTPSAGSSETSAATSAPNNSMQTATDCTPNVSGGTKPTGDTVSAGKLSFPTSTAPGWQPYTDDQNPNLIDAVGLGAEVPGASQWMMQVEVAVTNFVTSMDVSAQASKLLDCVSNGPGYVQSKPTLGTKKTSSITVDGVKAARVDADIAIGDTTRGVKGDTVTIIAVDTKPVTIFLGAVAIGDTASAGIVSNVIAGLKVSKK